VTPGSRRRLLLIAVAAIPVGGFLGAIAYDLVRSSWGSWAAGLVYFVRGPLVVEVTNLTTTVVPAVEVRIPGQSCFLGCLEPQERRTCRLHTHHPALLQARLPDAAFLHTTNVAFEALPAEITWRTHGTLGVQVTDAGFVLEGKLTDELW